MRALTYLFVTLFATTAAIAETQTGAAFPTPTGRVNDFANVIDPAIEVEIDRQLDQLEQKTSSEVAVATVPSLGDMSIEEYANRLFKEWGVGQAKQDNGVLIVVAPNDRAMRIEVGYGLEGVLPDGLAGQIIRDDFTPRFRENDYSGGIRNGVNRVVDVVERHQVLTPEELAKFNEGNSENPPLWILIPFFGVFVTIGFGMLGIGLRTKTGFPVIFGSFFGGIPLFMSTIGGALAIVTLVPWALAMFVAGYRLGGRKSWRDAFRTSGKGGGSGSSGGWTMGNTGSGSGGSSSSGSSSSFGGGSSGGGGASGRW